MSIVVVSMFALTSFIEKNSSEIITGDTSLSELLASFGEDFSDKKPRMDLKGVSVEAGRSIVHKGFASKPGGGKTKKQSKHFVCTSCHNVVNEELDLANPNPQSRLEFAQKEGIPFLQGTTLYGAVNRETYYNGDYEKKYGDLVYAARNNVREAIQLCATECAQGRALKDWEIESILAYMWTLELKVDDLLINGEELDVVQMSLEENNNKEESLALLKSKFSSSSSAHFILPPDDRKDGYGLTGDPDNGKKIYDISCMHCHERKRYSFFYLDDTKMTFKYLRSKMSGYAPHSIYQVIRWGVPSKSGKPSYMPQYTEERLSNQMVEDLRAYIEMRAE